MPRKKMAAPVVYPLALVQGVAANGESEWYFTLNGTKVLPPTVTEPLTLPTNTSPQMALSSVIAAWDGRWMP